MKFLKSVKGFTKGLAKSIKKGLHIGEKVVNTVDKMTGGQLRSYAAQATGGKSEALILGYNKFKNPLKKSLDLVEGKTNVKQTLEGTKYEGKYNKGIEELKKYENVAKQTGMIDKTRSTELGRNVLNTYTKIKPSLGI